MNTVISESDRIVIANEFSNRQGFPFYANLAALFRVGSHSHGTYIPPKDPNGIDDIDYMAIVIPPKERVLGLHKFDNCTIKIDHIDCVVYSWDKYIRLLLKSNPNVIGTLFMRPEDMEIPRSEPMQSLFRYRSEFISKQVYKSFMGYAQSQMYKMTHTAHQGYMGAKRKKLVEQYGYDVKNAAHLIRLLRMCLEFIETHSCVVFRHDAEELKEIKRGQWTLDEVIEEAQGLEHWIKEAYKTSNLRELPSESFAEAILLKGYKHYWETY